MSNWGVMHTQSFSDLLLENDLSERMRELRLRLRDLEGGSHKAGIFTGL
jgi:hypothetical protein